MPRIVIIGAGAWGSALAAAWNAEGRETMLLSRRADAAAPAKVPVTADAGILRGARIAVVAVSAQQTRSRLLDLSGALAPGVPVVLTAKGLERGTLLRQSEVAREIAPGHPLGVLSGPSFAVDVARGLPTAVTLAMALGGRGDLGDSAGERQHATAREEVQAALATAALRPYLTDDIVGVEIGGALKNVVAIACGAAMGAGYGESARAALMTRGLAEMTRLAVAMGARPETLAGLSGLGDLALTSSSERSRNYRYGLMLGRGEPSHSCGAGTFEGVATAAAAAQLADTRGIDAPIMRAVAETLDGSLTIGKAVQALLARPLRSEG